LKIIKKKKLPFIDKEKEDQKAAREKGEPLPATPLVFLDAEAGDKIAKEVIDKITSAVTKALNEDGEGSGVVSKEVRAFREKQAEIEREKKEREEEIERRKRHREDEERKILRRQKERDEREFKVKETQLMEHEKERERERKIYLEDLREKQIRRKQALLLDDEDEKPRRKKIRSRDARKKRSREKEDDDREKAKELHELEHIRREQEKKELEEERKRAAVEEQIRLEAEKDAQCKAEKLKGVGQFKTEQYIVPVHLSQQNSEDKKPPGFSVSLNMTSSTKKAQVPSNTPSKPIFNAEPEEETLQTPKKKRKLMVLEHEVAKHEDKKDEVVDAKARVQATIDKIPTDKAELFKFEMDWSLVDEHKIIDSKMRPWVKKKIMEYLGEEEQTLIDYICKKLSEHTPPDQLLDLLLLVLEDEAGDFVIRMWRMLIYNIMILGVHTTS